MTDSQTAYENCAEEFLTARDKSAVGSVIVETWSQSLKKGAAGVELGCGGGYPITQVLQNAGLKLWAVDGSPTLVSKFQSRYPQIPVQCAGLQGFDFFNRSFDFAIAIGVLFLLSESDQIQLIADVSKKLVPSGQLLLTAPIERGNWRDQISGCECRSLGQSRYEEIFKNAGFRVVATYEDVGKNHYYDLVLNL